MVNFTKVERDYVKGLFHTGNAGADDDVLNEFKSHFPQSNHRDETIFKLIEECRANTSSDKGATAMQSLSGYSKKLNNAQETKNSSSKRSHEHSSKSDSRNLPELSAMERMLNTKKMKAEDYIVLTKPTHFGNPLVIKTPHMIVFIFTNTSEKVCEFLDKGIETITNADGTTSQRLYIKAEHSSYTEADIQVIINIVSGLPLHSTIEKYCYVLPKLKPSLKYTTVENLESSRFQKCIAVIIEEKSDEEMNINNNINYDNLMRLFQQAQNNNNNHNNNNNNNNNHRDREPIPNRHSRSRSRSRSRNRSRSSSRTPPRNHREQNDVQERVVNPNHNLSLNSIDKAKRRK
ncbi:FYVE-type zinc finger-containing protein [Tieghemostelium lacteum]|uniref:FYVE-type zinc finger-containing protein n=1 Tax=Tieghemostelium lacteum TaxID=361077 RepID=A0A151ZK24_TIELA|nr:FYVE-type zinc finger-containing protein [Tieghemostelium lacteum]|eukprot:KYQ94164.1 FYVE-type zinc finger-containing protein [Tieghemostelium lacteum]